MTKTLYMLAMALGLSFAGCKKKNEAAGTASGSAGSGSAMMGSGSAVGSATGSATMGSATGSAMGSAMTGSGSAAPTGARPAGISDDLVAQNDKVTAVVKASVDDLKAANGDCAKIAKALDGATAKLKPETDKLGAMLDKLDEASQTYYGDEMTEELGAAFGAMDPLLAPCKDNAAVVDAAKNYTKTLVGDDE